MDGIIDFFKECEENAVYIALFIIMLSSIFYSTVPNLKRPNLENPLKKLKKNKKK